MSIEVIREKLKQSGRDKESNRQIIADWLAHDCSVKFEYGLTVMPRKVFYKYVPEWKGVKDNMLFRHLGKAELDAALHRLVKLLNDVIYKNAYRRYGKKLDMVLVVEGKKSKKDLHGHFALTKPAEMTVMEFKARVMKALELSGEFLIANKDFDAEKDGLNEKYRYKLDAVDSDWIYYITKELDGADLSNLYLP